MLLFGISVKSAIAELKVDFCLAFPDFCDGKKTLVYSPPFLNCIADGVVI